MNGNIKKTLTLSLKTKWFEMTKSGIKTEDYRELTPYWVRRLLNLNHFDIEMAINSFELGLIAKEKRNDINYFGRELIYKMNQHPTFYLFYRKFNTNTMTLGYPKSGDKEITLILEHKGIEIRTGNPEWGAEEGKLYFVIKHGKIIE